MRNRAEINVLPRTANPSVTASVTSFSPISFRSKFGEWLCIPSHTWHNLQLISSRDAASSSTMHMANMQTCTLAIRSSKSLSFFLPDQHHHAPGLLYGEFSSCVGDSLRKMMFDADFLTSLYQLSTTEHARVLISKTADLLVNFYFYFFSLPRPFIPMYKYQIQAFIVLICKWFVVLPRIWVRKDQCKSFEIAGAMSKNWTRQFPCQLGRAVRKGLKSI